MKSHLWRLATVGVLCVSVSGQVLADERGDGGPQEARPNGGQHGGQGQGASNQQRPEHSQGRQEGGQGNQPRVERSQSSEGRSQPQNGQWQGRPQQDANGQQGRPAQSGNQQHVEARPQQGNPAQPGNNLQIQPRPNAVQQTQAPNRGGNQNWQQGGGSNARPGFNSGGGNAHPNDVRWAGRPDGHGNGWGPGPQYRPGYVVERFQGQHWQVPYRGQNYFFSGGYWYRPQGPRYIVVQPPYGIRVGYLPEFSREVWVGSTLLFLAAGAYYAYQPATQDYIVVQPPATILQPAPQPVSNGYDVVAYPANAQTPAQIDQDRYDCYRWAVDQSGFDPAKITYAPAPAVVQTYRQAQGNCLSSRGYQVNY